MAGLYFEYHFPLALKTLIERLLGADRFNPGKVPVIPEGGIREWFSQPRVSTDPTVEVHTTRFKLPLSISELGAEFIRTPTQAEFWYQDRSNNWRQVMDKNRQPVVVNVSGSEAWSWYKHHSVVYPIVAKAVQVRLRRTPDPYWENRPFVVGMRNLLIKRNVYERNQGMMYLEEEQDPLGNVITKYVKDWDATKAIDSDASTFWRSAPQPDPSAVVSLYLDVRDDNGASQSFDKLYIDPVGAGQHLNVYFSNDDRVPFRRLSPLALTPVVDENTSWRVSEGRWDISATTGLPSKYGVKISQGPQMRVPMWFGMEWTPDFNPGPLEDPSLTPKLFQVECEHNTDAWSPSLTYDPGAGSFVLTFVHEQGQSAPIRISAPMNKVFVKGEPLRIVVGWTYDPKTLSLMVINKQKEVIASATASASLPDNVNLHGTHGFEAFRGNITAFVFKLGEDYHDQVDAFLTNPVVYVSPEPLLPDEDGVVPSSSLDNAILSVDFTQQQMPTGGTDSSEFEGKEWTPVWRNYVVEKGFLRFPQTINCRYLKLEFTNLNAEPYPVYEAGIDVKYRVYPLSVQQTASAGPRLSVGSNVGGLLGVANLNGVKTINWLNPWSVISGAQAVFGTNYDAVQVNQGGAYTSSTIPHLYDSPINKSRRLELSSNYVYRREILDPYVLARNEYHTIIKAEGLQKLQPYTNIPWQDIATANPGAISTRKLAGTLPVRGTDWWIFPGQELRIPAQVMTKLTDSSVVLESKATLETRVRFTTTAIHRYDIRTARRDASIAYFAGVREVIPMISSYIYGQDREVFEFPFYSQEQWSYTAIETAPSGAISRDMDVTTEPMGRAVFAFQTHSTFARLKVNFRDSGLLRSNAMWASSESDALTPEVTIIPEKFSANWIDAFAAWNDSEKEWGSPRGVVSVNIDGDRQYEGHRVLRFRRAPGAGEAGIAINQKINFVAGGLARIGLSFYKPFDNDNVIVLRLIRKADDSKVYEIPLQANYGRWIDYTTEFFELPDDIDPTEEFQVQCVLTGDEEDEMYVANLYTDISHVRYFVRLGDSGGYLHDVTELRYRENTETYVTSPSPVTQAQITTAILSDRGFAFGASFEPLYLK